MPRTSLRKKLRKYYGIFKGEDLNSEEIDRLIEKETEKLLRKELEPYVNVEERAT